MLNTSNVYFKCCVYLMMFLFISVPVLAQNPPKDSGQVDAGTDYLNGKTDGEMAAAASGAWFFAGFCGGLIGVLIAYSVKPSPSTHHLVGKTQAYINGYIDGYKDKAGSLQGKKALTGCVTMAAVYAIVYLAIIIPAIDSVD